MKVRAPAERNFRRARVKPARGKRYTARVSRALLGRLLGTSLVVLGLYQTVTLAFTTPLLNIDDIAVRGNVRLSSGEVQALVEDLRGTSILRADLDAFRRRLIDSPWIADVALRRLLPSTIEIFVAERRPIGLCRLGQELFLVDETGVVIDQFGPQYAEFDLPIVDGLVSGPAGRGAVQAPIDPGRADLAARAIASLSRDQTIAARLSQVDVSDERDAVVLLDGDPALLHLGDDRFLERVQGYLELSSTLRERVAEIDYVDLRFDRRVYVKPAGDARRKSVARQATPAARQF
jgi:cell division septal protein FtsQ